MYEGYNIRPMIDLTRVPSAPRLVHRRASLGFFLGPARLGTILSVLVALTLLGAAIEYVAVMAYGTDVTGRVTRRVFVHRGKTNDHYFEYEYPTDAGWTAGSDSVVPADFQGTFETMPLTVRTLRVGDIFGSAIPQTPPAMLWAHARFIESLLFACVIATTLVWRFFYLPFRYRQLLRDGEAAAGRITERIARIVDRRQWWKSNDTADDPYGERPTRYKLKYEFILPSGQRRRGSMDVGMGDFSDVKCGDEVIVFYDPNHPRFSVIYPFEDDVIVGLEPADEQLDQAA